MPCLASRSPPLIPLAAAHLVAPTPLNTHIHSFALSEREWIEAKAEEARALAAVQNLKGEMTKLRHYQHVDTQTLVYAATPNALERPATAR